MAPNSTHTASVQKPIQPLLLIAEDDPDDQLLLQEALAENNVPAESIHFAHDGRELLDLLATLPAQPMVILLDFNMPRLDGREALRAIKGSKVYRHIPVLVLTTSSSVEDIQTAYQSGANSFFTKPALFSELTETINLIKQYWLERAAIACGK